MILSTDIETYSGTDLRSAGLYRYTQDPTFEVLLIAYALDNGPVEVLDLKQNPDNPKIGEYVQMLQDPSIVKTAYNAAFEITCLSKHFNLDLDPAQWHCTMVQAASLGLPKSLAGAAKALGPDKKMEEGQDLIRYFCQPCRPTATNGGRTRNLPQHAQSKWITFVEYCRQDVVVERSVRESMANYPLDPVEQTAWEMDQRINRRGVLTDRDLVRQARALSEAHTEELMQESIRISGLTNPNSVAQLKEYLGLDSLTKADVKARVKTSEGSEQQLLSNRLELGKTSVAKYKAIETCCGSDGRVRGLFQFYGASRTGRWAGRLVQLQNLPRNSIKELDQARQLVLAGDIDSVKREISPSVNQVLSDLVRTAFIARPGYTLAVADFSAIEARVLAWLANERWRMEVFAGDGKIYEASAERMFNLPKGSVTKHDPMRQRGKVAELALGYGGSVGALERMGALDMGLGKDELPGLVNAWRAANRNIVSLWQRVNEAAMAAMHGNPGPELPYGLRFYRTGKLLHLELPSGRVLRYFRPFLTTNRFGGDSIGYESYDTGVWGTVETYGAKLVENIVQAIARDCLRDTMLKVEPFWPEIVMHIHDEVVIEVPKAQEQIALDHITSIMSEAISWAPGLLLRGDGYLTDYYRKD